MQRAWEFVIFFMIITIFCFQTELVQAVSDQSSFSIKVQATRELNSAVPGEKNIFVINVAVTDGTASSTQARTMQLFIDSRLEAAFQHALPYYFKHNLRGIGVGAHEIKVNVVDPNDCSRVLATASINVTVQ